MKNYDLIDWKSKDFFEILNNKGILLNESEDEYDYFIIGINFINMAFVNISENVYFYIKDDNFDYLKFFNDNFSVLYEIYNNKIPISKFKNKFHYFCKKN